MVSKYRTLNFATYQPRIDAIKLKFNADDNSKVISNITINITRQPIITLVGSFHYRPMFSMRIVHYQEGSCTSLMVSKEANNTKVYLGISIN